MPHVGYVTGVLFVAGRAVIGRKGFLAPSVPELC
jgi:hypothetical protein